ncbi:hypothetical protein [Nocardia carnea]|uniref:hypothetical protein n=1 Tax=Nocardia carnea TaxID=37328 RepID=UPI002455C04E|nr:hypothetical protein [Nocardia carnea]
MNNVPDYENPIIHGGGEVPDSWDHPKISRAFSPLDIKDATDQADKYWQMRNLWEEGVETFVRSAEASLAEAWSGPAAEQAKQAIKDYIDKHARPVTPALEMLSQGVRSAATSIENTKKGIPEPMDAGDSWVNRTWNGFWHDEEISRRTDEAREAMKSRYVEPFGTLDTQIPVIPVPIGPTSTADIPAPPPGGYNTDTGNPTATTSGNPNGTAPGETPTGETPGTTEEETQSETPGDDPTTPSTTTSPGETATAPAGTQPPTTPTVPAGTTPAGVTTGPGSPGGAPPGAETPGPGRTVSGAPNAAPGGPAGVAAATGTTAAGTRGMTGMPMGGAGAGRGGGQDDESNRSIPDYLINQENTDELLGDIPPTIEGGVIGSNPE